MTVIAFAAAAVLIIGITAAICYLAGREHGHHIGFREGYKIGWDRCEFDAEMDAMNPDTGYAELHDGEVTS